MYNVATETPMISSVIADCQTSRHQYFEKVYASGCITYIVGPYLVVPSDSSPSNT